MMSRTIPRVMKEMMRRRVMRSDRVARKYMPARRGAGPIR